MYASAVPGCRCDLVRLKGTPDRYCSGEVRLYRCEAVWSLMQLSAWYQHLVWLSVLGGRQSRYQYQPPRHQFSVGSLELGQLLAEHNALFGRTVAGFGSSPAHSQTAGRVCQHATVGTTFPAPSGTASSRYPSALRLARSAPLVGVAVQSLYLRFCQLFKVDVCHKSSIQPVWLTDPIDIDVDLLR